MARLDNVFTSIRRRGDEVQLSAMFAHVLHRDPALCVLTDIAGIDVHGAECSETPRIEVERTHDAGRCDIWVGTDSYEIIIENKIGARFRKRQLEDYAGQLRDDVPGKVIAITALPDPYRFAEDVDPGRFVLTTWSLVAERLRAVADGPNLIDNHIISEFITMLEEDGLVAPPLTPEVVAAWGQGFDVYRWLRGFLSFTRRGWNATADGARGFAPAGEITVTSRPNMVMWSTNRDVRVGIGCQLPEGRLFVVAYAPLGKATGRKWITSDAAVRLSAMADWSKYGDQGVEAFYPLSRLAGEPDSQTAATRWIDDRLAEIRAAGFGPMTT